MFEGCVIVALMFIYGFGPEKRLLRRKRKYREWYERRYHRPQDDLTQPVDFDTATKFNQFFYRLVAKVANGGKKPDWIR